MTDSNIMLRCLLLLLWYIFVNATHFDGGTIRWVPVDPYDNSSSVTITIIQSYWWTYPAITCANDVPVTTSGRANADSNLTCVVDCSNDGGYSSAPITTLTDCTSVSSSLGMMTSERLQNITLTASAYFYLAYVGSAWVALGDSAQNGLAWSITTLIDLQIRPDGFINTPPAAAIISPQYIIVNITTQIHIPVSDVNIGDDVRCRWAIYTNGFRRRRQINEDLYSESTTVTYRTSISKAESILNRKARSPPPPQCRPSCAVICRIGCPCTCFGCLGTSCSGFSCRIWPTCLVGTTTIDTPGTLKPTSSYPVRQAIDECGGICYPNMLPNNTNLSNCILSITGLAPGTWYAAAIQVEDFINVSSNTPMSSVPVQFLIYVMPEPTCSDAPIIIPVAGCLEVTVDIPISFDLFILNLCDPTMVGIADVVISKPVTGIQKVNLTSSPTNTSLNYVTFTWTPQTNQIGPQQMCAVAYTDEQVQSTEYCVTFNVTTSFAVCITTTTTTTASTTTTSTETSSTSTTTTGITSVTTVTVAVTTTTTKSPGQSPSWGLIAGIASIALPLALCTCCCLYHQLWSSTARLNQQEQEEFNQLRYSHLSSTTESTARTTSDTDAAFRIRKPSKSYQVYNILSEQDSVNTSASVNENESSILMRIYNNTNARRPNNASMPNVQQSFEMGNSWIQSHTPENVVGNKIADQHHTLNTNPMTKISDLKKTHESLNANRQPLDQERLRAFPTSPIQNNSYSSPPSSLNNMPGVGQQPHGPSSGVSDFEKIARKYLLGTGHNTKTPRV